MTPAYPGLGAAFLLTLGAWLLTAVLGVLLHGFASPVGAAGIGSALAFGAFGALAARRVPPPHGARLGLRPFPPRALPWLVLLVPNVLLASEVGNLVQGWLPAPDADAILERLKEQLAGGSLLARIEVLLVTTALAPVVEEWFFRGVVQQGLVARHGPLAGIVLTAALFAAPHGAPGLSAGTWVALSAAVFVHGLVLGAVRHWTGSLLAAMVLHAALNAVQISALLLVERVPIPGFTAAGAHTPPELLVAAILCVALGLFGLSRAARPRPS